MDSMPPLRRVVQDLARLGRPARIALVRAGALGDTILLLPAAALLRQQLPDAALTLIGTHWAAQLAPLMDRPWTAEDFGSSRLTPLFTPDARADLPPSLREADLVVVYAGRPDDAFAANVRRLSGGEGERVIVWPAHPAADVHAAAHFAGALTERMPARDDLPLPALRAGEGRRGGGRLLVVHPGSGGAAKCWPAQRFAQLMRGLSRRLPDAVLLQGPADERACAAVLDALMPGERPAVVRPANVAQAAAVLARAALYVGNDSGITHLAAALGAPTVAVFGPTDPAVWSPLGARVRVVSSAGGWPAVASVLAGVDLVRTGATSGG